MKKSLQLGKLKLACPVIYAPLAGCSDYPFRKMAAQYKPGLMYCEMVKMEALLRGNAGTLQMLERCAEMEPVGAQLCGSQPQLAGPAARIIEEMGFPIVDLNCGCPVDKVTKDGSGSGMLKNPERIGEVIAEMVAAVSIPVTVKIRIGWDHDHINATEVTRIAEAAGAVAITIHGRTRSQAYRGPADWEHIKACKEVARSIQVIGNGDLFTAEDALRMFEQTGCDGVLIARGTMGRPWIAQEIREALSGGSPGERSFEACREALLQHLDYSEGYKSEKGAMIDMRKIACWYFKNVPGAREFRAKASHAQSLLEMRQLVEDYAGAACAV